VLTPEADRQRWDALRLLRNDASHPKAQSIYLPSWVLTSLEAVVELLNGLWEDAPATSMRGE
jgi:hypothetical protein